MTDISTDTGELTDVDRSIREIYDMEINGRRSFRRDAMSQVKNVIKSIEAIPRVPVLCVSEAVKEQLEESLVRFELAEAEPTEFVAPVRTIPKELWPSLPVVVVPPPIQEEPEVSPVTLSYRPKKISSQPREKIPSQPRERRTRVSWQQGLWPSSKTGVKGCSWCASKQKWRAQIAKDYKNYPLGFFEDKFDAARAYDAKAIELFGPDARTNASLGLIPPQEAKKPISAEPLVVTPAPAEPASVSSSTEPKLPSQPGVRGVRKDSVSGCRGCSWYPRTEQWRVAIHKDGQQTTVGFFTDLLEAAKAYDKAAKELFGEAAFLNFPSEV
jgi:hypothetical protein